MRELVFVLNGRARNGHSIEWVHEARRSLWGYDLRFVAPESLDELRETLRAIDATRCHAIVTCGGDGTVNAVINALDRIDVPNMPAQSLEELMEDPHHWHNGFFREVDHPSEGRLRMMGSATRRNSFALGKVVLMTSCLSRETVMLRSIASRWLVVRFSFLGPCP